MTSTTSAEGITEKLLSCLLCKPQRVVEVLWRMASFMRRIARTTDLVQGDSTMRGEYGYTFWSSAGKRPISTDRTWFD